MMRLQRLALFGAALVLPAIAQADETRVSADVSTGLGYANNPFSIIGDDTGGGFVEASIRPQVQLLNEHSTFTASAEVQVQQYFQHYSTTDSYQGKLAYRGRPSDHISTHLYAGFQSSIIGSLNNYSGIVFDPGKDSGPIVSTPIDPTNSGTDIGLFGTRARQHRINAGGDVTAAVSARDQLTASAFYIDSRYSRTSAGNNIGNYDGFGGAIGYSRQLSQYTQIGVQASGSRYNYDAAGADSNVYALEATFSTRLNAVWSANGAAGASFVDRTGTGVQTSFSGNIVICHTGARATACLTALRAVLPTGILGTQTETSVGGSYRYRLNEHGTLGFTGNYTSNGMLVTNTPVAGLTNSNEYAQGTISYDRQLRKRVRLITSAHYRKIYGGALDRAADYGGQVGLSLRLGDTR